MNYSEFLNSPPRQSFAAGMGVCSHKTLHLAEQNQHQRSHGPLTDKQQFRVGFTEKLLS